MIWSTRWMAAVAVVPIVLAITTVKLQVPRVSWPDRSAAKAWSAALDREFGPEMADCLRFEIEARVPRADLNSMLARSDGGARPFPVLQRHLDRALDRCLRRHGGTDWALAG